jgi:hypothetical protein
MFRDRPDDAKAWTARRSACVARRMWFIAELRRLADGRPNSGTGVTGA